MRSIRSRGWLSVLGTAALLAALFVLAASAQAAFPGRDGLLAVQPLNGSGIVLVSANGSGKRVVRATIQNSQCNGCSPLSRRMRPAWSPDGRTLLVSGVTDSSFLAGLIYPDGSCLDCRFPVYGADAVFTNNPTLFTVSQGLAGLSEYGIDGMARGTLLSGAVSDPAWSSRGQLAVVHGVRIWVGRLPWLRPLVPGSTPTWSPDGRQIAFARSGWLWVGPVRGRPFRRLVRGSAPSWSPDGRWIAFFGKHQRLSVVRASGGRVRQVGVVTGRMADWQPLPTTPPHTCPTPPATFSAVRASSDTAVVNWDSVQQPSPPYGFGATSTWALMGCLRADGRERLLDTGGDFFEFSSTVDQVELAGPYAGVVISGGGKCGGFGSVELFDLRTGAQVPNRGGEGTPCGMSVVLTIDQLVLGSDAVSAVHMTQGCYMCGTPSEEMIQASDRTGVHTLDSINEPSGTPPALTNLTLTGDTLTWEHNGSPRSAQLQP